jgi:mono/diheme cytochrome c family protein
MLVAVLALLAAACSGTSVASVNPPVASTSTTTVVSPGTGPMVRDVAVADFYQGTCAACHGPDRTGVSGPALLPETLIEEDGFYAATIRDGRPDLGMPAWGALGLTDAEVDAIVDYLRTAPGDAPVVAAGESVLVGADSIELGPIERGASMPFLLELTNPTVDPVEIIRFTSPSLSLFINDALPVLIEPGESHSLAAVFVHPPATEIGADIAGNASMDLKVGGRATSQAVTVAGTVVAPHRTLAWVEQGLPSQPARLAAWDRYLYVGYFNGLIDVFEFTGIDELTRVEQIETIASTPNHGPDGTPSPDQSGRLIGGMAVGNDGTLYVTHSDPRLNEGEFVRTGHLADLNSGMVTALDGPPGSYGAFGHRRDLITGLPRNVTNHVPLGLVVDAGRLFVVVGSMTDSGVPDPSKPDPENDLSGTILRLDLDTDPSVFPLALTEPGPDPARLDDLVPGVLDVWATGVRNGFGLTMHEGTLYLTDQGSDGGGVPSPGEGIPGFGPHFGSDHLHEVPQGAFLGQPNSARRENILDDGSIYEIPVPNPAFTPPVHKFGIHNSATGITFYERDLFPELEGQLLVGRFSVTVGVHALEIEDGRASTVSVVAGPTGIGNITDVVVGPEGQIVMAAFWDLKVLIATGWQ